MLKWFFLLSLAVVFGASVDPAHKNVIFIEIGPALYGSLEQSQKDLSGGYMVVSDSNHRHHRSLGELNYHLSIHSERYIESTAVKHYLAVIWQFISQLWPSGYAADDDKPYLKRRSYKSVRKVTNPSDLIEIEVVGHDSLTKTQLLQVEQVKQNVNFIGRLIKTKGDESWKNALNNISKVKIDITSGKKPTNSRGSILLPHKAIDHNSAVITQTDFQRFVITHEICHSAPDQKLLMQSAINRQMAYDPSVPQSPTRVREQGIDMATYRFLTKNNAISETMNRAQDYSGYWP